MRLAYDSCMTYRLTATLVSSFRTFGAEGFARVFDNKRDAEDLMAHLALDGRIVRGHFPNSYNRITDNMHRSEWRAKAFMGFPARLGRRALRAILCVNRQHHTQRPPCPAVMLR